jgi:hypothetical protein
LGTAGSLRFCASHALERRFIALIATYSIKYLAPSAVSIDATIILRVGAKSSAQGRPSAFRVKLIVLATRQAIVSPEAENEVPEHWTFDEFPLRQAR